MTEIAVIPTSERELTIPEKLFERIRDAAYHQLVAEGQFKWRLVMTKRVRKRIAEGKMTEEAYKKRLYDEMPGKAWCICGGSHVLGVPWMVRDKVIQRWREFYRVSKDGAVWFLTCFRHGRFHRWAERILTDEDRQGKTVHIVNF